MGGVKGVYVVEAVAGRLERATWRSRNWTAIMRTDWMRRARAKWAVSQ